MRIRELKKGDLKAIDKLMAEIGFFRETYVGQDDILAYWRDVEDWDRENVINHLKPHHFVSTMQRMAFVANGYVTSNIRGTFRGYRCRNSYDGYDAGNIFAHSNNTGDIILAVQNFVIAYKNKKYNRSLK
jgi:hypothetical protein